MLWSASGPTMSAGNTEPGVMSLSLSKAVRQHIAHRQLASATLLHTVELDTSYMALTIGTPKDPTLYMVGTDSYTYPPETLSSRMFLLPQTQLSQLWCGGLNLT